jgi:hypothetical protein
MSLVGSGHPNACDFRMPDGPCPYEKLPDQQYCQKHRASAICHDRKAQLQNYIINSAFGKRAAEMSRSPHLKSLTDEIVLTRVSLEALFRKIQSDDDIIVYNDRIIALTNNIQKLMESAQKMQERNRELLDRNTIFSIADAIMGIIAVQIDDPDKMSLIAEQIYESIIARISGPNEGHTSAEISNQSVALGNALPSHANRV